MNLSFNPDEKSPLKWYAATDDGGYDAAGESPVDALAALVVVLEHELAEDEDPLARFKDDSEEDP